MEFEAQKENESENKKPSAQASSEQAKIFDLLLGFAASVFSSNSLLKRLGPGFQFEERHQFEKPEWKQHRGFGPWNE